MYTIEIYYRTGNSFGSEYVTETIGMAWTNFEKAIQGLQELTEFNDFYEAYHNEYKPDDKNKVVERMKRMPWHEKCKYNDFTMTMETDDGDRRRVDTNFITGYFEEFESAKIILTEESLGSYNSHQQSRMYLEDIISKYGK